MYEIVYKDIEEKKEYEEIVEKVIKQCYKEERMEDSKLLITITLTTPDNIQEINRDYRGIDKATDVLSFPMFEKNEIDELIENQNNVVEDVLGDIIISVDLFF